MPNYRALSRAALQHLLINDGDYMTENTTKAAEAASDLNDELGMACVGCVSEFKNELRCYDCTVTSNGKGSKFLDVEDLSEPTTEKMQKQVRRSIIAAMRFLGINSDGV